MHKTCIQKACKCMIGSSKFIRKCLKPQGFTEREMHTQSSTVTHV